MSRLLVNPSHNYRAIVFLCQECGGDLRRIRQHVVEEEEWECSRCRLVWVYGDEGWDRVQQ